MLSSSSRPVSSRATPHAGDAIGGTTAGDHADDADATFGGPPGLDDAASTDPISCPVTLGRDDVRESLAAPTLRTAATLAAEAAVLKRLDAAVLAPEMEAPAGGGGEEGEKKDARIYLDDHVLAPRPALIEGKGAKRLDPMLPMTLVSRYADLKGRGDRAPPLGQGGADDERPSGELVVPPPRLDGVDAAAAEQARPSAEQARPPYWGNTPGAYRVFPYYREGRSPADDCEDPTADASEDAGLSPEVRVADATVVEEVTVYDGAPLEPPATLWQHRGMKRLACASCSALAVLVIAFGMLCAITYHQGWFRAK